MDWLHVNGCAPSLGLLPLGTYYNNQYYISDQCLVSLEDLIRQLNCADSNHSRRRGLGYVDIINKDLKPIMMSSSRSWPKLFRSTVKLLVGITTPIEHLTFGSIPDQRGNSHVIYELRQLLYKAKVAFRDGSATRAIIDHAKHLLSKQPLSRDEIEFLNFSLLLIRNILDAPERPVEDEYQQSSLPRSYNNELDHHSQQNDIIFNLLAQGFGKLLLEMLSNPACLEKDRHCKWLLTIVQVVAALYKDFSFENIQTQLSSMMQSNEDVSAGDDHQHYPSWHLLPPYPETPQTLSATSSSSSTSTMSGNEPQMVNKKRWKGCTRKLGNALRKDLSEERHTCHLLAKFTIDFMLKGFSILLKQLMREQLLRQDNQLLDKSDFLWLLVNFLPLASQLGQKPNFMKKVLTTDVMCYLILIVVQETEEVQLNSLDAAVDPKPSLRRLHLGIRAIFEYLQALENYSLAMESNSNRHSSSQCTDEWVSQLRRNLLAMTELRQLLVLQLRHFDIEVQSPQCLCDIICANHILLLTLEQAIRQSGRSLNFHLDYYLNQFCTSSILDRYGSALEEFRTNDHIVSESIFAMLRLVSFDLGRLDLVCEPIILRSLCKIWEEGFEICSDWHDLIERLVRKFTENLFDDTNMISPLSSNRPLLNKEDFQIMESDQQLSNNLGDQFASKRDPFMETYGEIESLIRQLTINGYKKQLAWIQSSLLTACATRLGTYAGQEFHYPVSSLCMVMKIPCPMVPWTELEAAGLRSEQFRRLLQQIGLIPHSLEFFFYPKIPCEWSADILYSFSLLFGPVDDHMFDLAFVKKVDLPISSDF